MKRGKKYTAAASAVDKSKLYESAEALGLVCEIAKAKFDETVELHVRLGGPAGARCGRSAERHR